MGRFWKQLFILTLMISLFCCTVISYAEEIETLETPEEQIVQLQQQIEELEALVAQLTEENEALKSELENGSIAEEESKIDVPDNVVNADSNTEYSDKSTVLLVQQTLNGLGYNCGSADGVAGAKTREVISNYQKEHGLTENGIITDQLLESLGIADKVAEEAKKEAEKASYSSEYSYTQLARNPDTYVGEKMKFSGKVLQAQSGDICYLRLAIDSNYDEVIFVTYDKDLIDYRILEDDKITVYGMSMGDYSYEAVSGATITIPWLLASMIELN